MEVFSDLARGERGGARRAHSGLAILYISICQLHTPSFMHEWRNRMAHIIRPCMYSHACSIMSQP